jgi:ribosome-associated protein
VDEPERQITPPHPDVVALVNVAVRAADAKLGEQPVALDLAELLGVVDAFVIVSGRNARQVSSIVEEVEEQIKREMARSPIRLEGHREANWVLMDYGDVVIHVFLDETREFYDLEHLWSSAPRIDVSALVSPRTAGETDQAR